MVFGPHHYSDDNGSIAAFSIISSSLLLDPTIMLS